MCLKVTTLLPGSHLILSVGNCNRCWTEKHICARPQSCCLVPPLMNRLQNTVRALCHKQTACHAICMLYKVEVDPAALAVQSRGHLLSHHIEYAVTCITDRLWILFERFNPRRSSKLCGCNYSCFRAAHWWSDHQIYILAINANKAGVRRVHAHESSILEDYCM